MTDNTELYREILLDHGQHPRGEGLLDPCDRATQGSNPDTGDVVNLTLRLADGQITAIGFTAAGSAVLRASCSLMAETLTGLSAEVAAARVEQFIALLTTQADNDDWAGLGDAVALRGIRQFPARVRCAVLPWRTVARLLED